MDAKFLSALASTDGGKDDGTVEQGLENIELRLAAKSTDACGENPSKRLKLSLLRAKSRDEFRPANAPIRMATLMLGALADSLNLLLLPNARRLLKV